jgi:hypothetical protein
MDIRCTPNTLRNSSECFTHEGFFCQARSILGTLQQNLIANHQSIPYHHIHIYNAEVQSEQKVTT